MNSAISTGFQHTFGVNAWKQWVLQKNDQMVRGSQSSRKFKLFKTDLLQLPPDELNYSLSLFVKEVRKPNGEEYGSGSIYYLCLGIQKYLFQNGRIDNIFSDPYYEKFTECLHDILLSQDALSSMEGFPSSRIEEETLWESKQLGAHSPYALLNTVMYFNTKYFKLKSVDDHLRLSFNHMYVIYERKTPEKLEKSAFLRYYPNGRKCELKDCRHSTIFCLGRRCMVKECKHKDTACQGSDCELDSEECEKNICLGIRCEAPECKHAVPVCIDAPRKDPSENSFQQIEHASDSLRCPVRLYEFYLSKCPESCRNRNDMFYLHPERSCVPDSPVWYSGVPLGHDVLSKMMQRIKIVREIYES